MRVHLTAFAFDAVRTFAQAVRSSEDETRIRVVVGKSKNTDDSKMMLRAGLDRGELKGINYFHEQSGLEFVFVHGALAELDDDVVFWLRNMDDLTLESSQKMAYAEEMGDAQGELVLLVAA